MGNARADASPRPTRQRRHGPPYPCVSNGMAICLATLLWAPPAMAQTQAPAQTSPKPSAPVRGQAAAADQARQLLEKRTRWDSLPEADRMAIQDSLVWLGLYNGVVDGAFGQRTSDAVTAFEKRDLLQPGAVLSGTGLAVLRAAASREKTAAGFVVMDDPATGMRIGAPARLFDRRASAPGRTRLSSTRSAASLTLFSGGADDGDLPAWFARATGTTAPGRKITYKILRPDFAVVTGDEGATRFFTRVAAGPEGLRGFTFVYPVADAAKMDRVTIAIANSFTPFAGKPGAPVATPGGPQPGLQASGAQAPGPQAAAAETLAGGTLASGALAGGALASGALAGTALMVAPGRAITATTALRDCRDIRLGDAPATIIASDRDSGLSLLQAGKGGPSGSQPPIALGPSPQPDAPLTFVTYATDETGKPRLSTVAGVAGTISGQIVAALQRGGPGSLALDQNGALAGMVASLAAAPRIGGVALAATHAMPPSDRMTPLLKQAGATVAAGPVAAESQATGPLTTGAIIARWRARLAPVSCMAPR